MFAQVTYPTKGSLLSSCDQPTVSIPAVSNSVPLLSDCRFRPALPQDRRSIRLLLHTAPPADSAQQPLLSLRIGGLLALLLCGLLLLGGLQLLLYGTLTLCVVAFLSWLNSRLFEDWQNYWVVEWVDAPNGRVIACGQLSHYPIFSLLNFFTSSSFLEYRFKTPSQRAFALFPGTLLLHTVILLPGMA